MTREEQIKEASIAYTEVNCPKAIGGDYFRNKINQCNTNHDFIEGAQWADKTMLQEVLKWLDENFSEHEDYSFDFVEDIPYQCPITCDFESKEQMLQSFKERFNIE